METPITREFIKELSEEINYLEIVEEDPVIVSENELKKNIWDIFGVLFHCSSFAKRFLNVDELGAVLEKNEEKFKGSYVTFLPSNIRLYDTHDVFGAQLSGRYLERHNACYVYMGATDPISIGLHEFGHESGIAFYHGHQPPNVECVMNLPSKTRAFCQTCQETINDRVARYVLGAK